MNFRPIAHLDTWRLCASLHARQSLLKRPLHACPLILRLEGTWTEAADEKWQALRNVVARIGRLPDHEQFESGRVLLWALVPHEGTDWDSNGWERLHLPIVTNPGVVAHSGPEAQHIPAGLLTWVNGVPLSCVVNHGEFLAAHLVIEFRAREKTT